MSRPCYIKQGYIIVENKNKKKDYYTVINTNLKEKPHSHFYKFEQAKLVIHWCIKGVVPNKYSYHMRQSIIRLRPDIDLQFGNTRKEEDIKELGSNKEEDSN